MISSIKINNERDLENSLLEKVDTLMIGGGMAYTFFKAQGYNVGNSLCEVDKTGLPEAGKGSGKTKTEGK